MKAIAVLTIMLAATVNSSADEPRPVLQERREFQILVKGAPAGKSELSIVEQDDGSTVVTTDADVTVSTLIYTYRYAFHGVETWNAAGLHELVSRANDDGKKLSVHVKVDRDGSTIEANGRPTKTAVVLALTTNYWRLPVGEGLPREVDLVDADQGTISHARVEFLGNDQLVVQEERVAARHFRLSGGVQAELWFDRQDRLVRQQTIEDGAATELRLLRKSTQTALPERR